MHYDDAVSRLYVFSCIHHHHHAKVLIKRLEHREEHQSQLERG